MALGAKDSPDLGCNEGWHGRREEGGVAWGAGRGREGRALLVDSRTAEPCGEGDAREVYGDREGMMTMPG